MKILKDLIVIGIVLQVLLLSGCAENTNNTAGSEFIDSDLSESDVDAGEDAESIDNNLFESYVIACEDGDAEACFKAGQVYSSEAHKELDYDRDQAAEKVAHFYLRSCEFGFAQGCTAYAMSHTADSQQDSNKDARYYFQKGCDGGDDTACTMLKMMPEEE